MSAPYITKFGFIADPFQHTNADKEAQNLKEYFVVPDYFESIWGDPDNPVPNIIYAPRGAGKTAQRIMLETRNKEYPDILSINYIFHDLSKFTSADEVTINYHLEYLNRILLLSFLKNFNESSYADNTAQFDFEERHFIFKLAKTYLYQAPASFSKNGLRSLKYLEDDIIDIWNYLKKPLTNLVSVVTKAKGVPIELDGIPEKTVQEKNLQEDFRNIIHFTKKLGFRCIYLFVDKVDELELTSTEPEAGFKFIKPLLKNLEILEFDGLAFKFFLWDKIKEFTNGDIRHDRIYPFELSWNNEQLTNMLNKRCIAYSKNKVSEIHDLFETKQSLEKVLLFAEHSPRDCIMIFKTIISEQQRIDKESEKINTQVVDDAIIKFMRQKTRDIIKSEKIRTILKTLKKIIFTEKDLVDKDLFFNRQEARSFIDEIKKLGIINNVGTKIISISESEKIRFNRYAINDCRVAKFIFPKLSINDFILKKTKICETCGDKFVNDNTLIKEQCENCDGD